MYAFNRRLEARTIAGMPAKTTIGLFFVLGALVCSAAFRSVLAFLALSPFLMTGLLLAWQGWKAKGNEHLLGVLAQAQKDFRTVDLGITEK